MSKRDKTIYWITTGIVASLMLFNGIGYFTLPMMKESFVHLGFPNYFRIELGIAKLLACVALILPIVPKTIKIVAYVGLAITFISAIVAHASVGDGIERMITPVIFLLVLLISAKLYLKKEVSNN